MLDGVVSVIDVENWQGYEDTSYTAKMQARYTDLVVLNKWETAGERRMEECRDRLGDLEIGTAVVRSEQGRVDAGALLGLDGRMVRELGSEPALKEHAHQHDGHDHVEDHQREVEVLSVILSSGEDAPAASGQGVNTESLEELLRAAPKDEVYRIKAILWASSPPKSSGDETTPAQTGEGQTSAQYILNWAFGRWNYTPLNQDLRGSGKEHAPNGKEEGVPIDGHHGAEKVVLRMTVVLARGEADSWRKKIESSGCIEMRGGEGGGGLEVKRLH